MQYPYLLRGVVRCAACGRTMRAHTIGARHPYYRCSSVDRPSPNAEPCPARGNVRADKVDDAVWSFLHDLLSRPGALQAEVERSLEAETPAESADVVLSTLDAELRALEQARARVIRMGRDGLISEDETRAELQDLDQRRRPLVARREMVVLRRKDRGEVLERLVLVQATLAEVAARVGSLSLEERRGLVEALVEEVTVDARTKEISVRCALVTPEPAPADDPDQGGSTPGQGEPPYALT